MSTVVGPVTCTSADATREFGQQLAQALRPGDLLVLTGDLGAGKTTLVQGIAAGLHVRGRVTSPTYIVSRVHPAIEYGPDLIHVDAYRIEDGLDLETVDLDASLEDSVTVVEWGKGKVEDLAEQFIEVDIAFDAAEEDARVLSVIAHGEDIQERFLRGVR